MSELTKGNPQADDESLLDQLIARSIEALELEGAAAVDRICAEHPEHAKAILARLARLRHRDLLHPPQDGPEFEFEPGTVMGVYEISKPLGAGAMGRVYLARDTRLGREAAIKVLPTDFATDAEHRKRFEREACSLASLNHPHIAQIFGVDQVDQTSFIAMEYVPGQNLSDRIRDGRLPVEDALRICRDVADGLESAHEAGIVHRDLKPANVRVTPDCRAKVLDFGLAKPPPQRVDGEVDDSRLQTRSGAVLGTPVYMSPEQVRGWPVDRRTDVWAFGCLLYECLTGHRAFHGDTFFEVASAILDADVELSGLPRSTPPSIRRLIQRCLRKDPRERLRDIGDARVELEDLLSGRSAGEVLASDRRSDSSWRVASGLLAGAVLGMAGYAVLVGSQDTTDLPGGEAAYSIPLRHRSASLIIDSQTGATSPLAISPDGRRILMAARGGDRVKRLFERRVDTPELRALAGTEGADWPSFSQDGQHTMFARMGAFAVTRVTPDGTLKSIRRNQATGVQRGVSWGPKGTIVFADQDQGLVLMSEVAKKETRLTEVSEGEVNHRWPQFLPDGRVLYTALLSGGRGRQEVRIVNPSDGTQTILPDLSGNLTQYLSGSGPDPLKGFLVYERDQELYAVRMNLVTSRINGQPRRVLSGIHVSQLGIPHMALAETAGTLVFEPVRPPSPGRSLVWVDRQGQEAELHSGHAYEFPRLSPTESKVLFAHHTPESVHEVWIVDFGRARAVGSKVHTTLPNSVQPLWSPDGKGVIFGDFQGRNMWIQRALAEPPVCLKRRPNWQLAREWDTHGRVRFQELVEASSWNLCEAELAESGDSVRIRVLLDSDAAETAGTLSPDRRWYAFVSNHTGRREIYVRRYEIDWDKDLGPAVYIGPGTEPNWSPDGKELFYRHRLSFYSVMIDEHNGGAQSKPQALFEDKYVAGFNNVPNYAVAADGKRFVFVTGGLGLTQNRLDVRLNLRRTLDRLFAED